MKVKNVTGSILQTMEHFAPQELEEMWGITRWDAVMILDTVARIMQQDSTVIQTRLPKRLRPLTAEEVAQQLAAATAPVQVPEASMQARWERR